MGRVAPTAYFNRGGQPQKLADQDYAGAERVTGCDLFSKALTNNTSNVGGFPGSVYWAAVSPNQISSRVAAVEEMYQWYAIRSLKIHHSPTVGTGTAGSVALGISTDAQISVDITSPNQQQVMELQPSLLTPVWGFATCELLMRGTRLFESYASSEGLDERFQCYFAAAYNAIAGTQLATGQLWVEYVIDFYQQTPLLSAVDLFKTGRTCPRCKQHVQILPMESKMLTAPPKGQNSQVREERKLPSATEPDSPVLVSGLSTPGRQQDHLEQSVAAVRSAHGARASSTKGGY